MSGSPAPSGTPPRPGDLAEQVAGALDRLRTQVPLVQCLTNNVVTGFTANALLAAGASPVMVDNVEEAGLMAGAAGGVLVNLGTPQQHTVDAMRLAVVAAGAAGRPWVLDPVAAGALPWRTAVAGELLDLAPPRVIRGNASEVAALTGGVGGRGVESTDRPEGVADATRALAAKFSCTVAVSGPVDLVTDGQREVRLHNGHPIMTKVTGVGCVLGALVAAFAAITDDGVLAATAATALLTVAADRAAATTRGPGSFAVALLDELSAVDPALLAATARLS